MTTSYSVNRKSKKAPLTGLLMVVFFITLILVVVNQVFVNVSARQEQVYSRLIADMRVLSLELSSHAEAVAEGKDGAGEMLANSLAAFETSWVLLNKGRENHIDTGLGISTRLPGQQLIIDDNFSVIPQIRDRITTHVEQIQQAAQEPQPNIDTIAAGAIVTDSAVLLDALTSLGDFLSGGGKLWFESPLTGYGLLLVLLLTIGLYGRQVITHSREAEQFTAEKNKRNNQAVLKLIGEISSLADGDLTVEASVSEELTGSIADSINYAVGQLRGLVSAITGVTLDVTTSMDSSRQMVEALSEASRRQNESIDSVYVSIRKIGNDINLVSDNAHKSLNVAETSVATAAGGAEVVKDTIKGMDNIREQIQDTSKRIKRLGESSQEIGGFVSLINDIAEHTNTLSLNAAIQAASAGDAGRGFAVVADEVHALAERSGEATRKIESLVKVIQNDIKEAVQSMEQTTAEVVAGTGLAKRAGTALDDIQKVSKELAELVSSITKASSNQTKAASELTGSMEVIRQVTSKASNGIKETREFMIKLGDLTERLKLVVAGFSLNKKDKWLRLNKDNVTSMDKKKDQKKLSLEIGDSTAELNRNEQDAFSSRIVNA